MGVVRLLRRSPTDDQVSVIPGGRWRTMIISILIPVATGIYRTPFQNGFGPLHTPSCPGDIHPVIDQVPASSFRNTAGNGQPLLPMLCYTEDVTGFSEGNLHTCPWLLACSAASCWHFVLCLWHSCGFSPEHW